MSSDTMERIIAAVWCFLAGLVVGLLLEYVILVTFPADSVNENDLQVVLPPSESLQSPNLEQNWAKVDESIAKPVIDIQAFEEADGYEPELESKQTFVLEHVRITHYCPCEKCCGPNARGITASGTIATAGRTVGVDPTVIPYGSIVTIDGGRQYIAEDTGGRGVYVDIFVDDHDEALRLGMYYADVEVELQ